VLALRFIAFSDEDRYVMVTNWLLYVFWWRTEQFNYEYPSHGKPLGHISTHHICGHTYCLRPTESGI